MNNEYNEIKSLNLVNTIKKAMEIVGKEIDRQHTKKFKDFAKEMKDELNEIHNIQSEITSKIQKAIDDMNAYQVKGINFTADRTYNEENSQLKEEVVQLKEEIIQLRKENLILKNQIQNLWKLFTSFLEKKITATRENWASFFSKNKDASISPLLEEENNSKPSL